MAKERLHNSGYEYAKGKSRSIKFGLADEQQREKPKREKIDQEERQLRIESLTEQLKYANKHIRIKERLILYIRIQLLPQQRLSNHHQVLILFCK